MHSKKLIFRCLLFVFSFASINFGEISQQLQTYQEVVEKQLTLNWISQPQQLPLFEKWSVGLDADTIAYVKNNVYGTYKAVILQNYQLKMQELKSEILQGLLENPEEIEPVARTIKRYPHPNTYTILGCLLC